MLCIVRFINGVIPISYRFHILSAVRSMERKTSLVTSDRTLGAVSTDLEIGLEWKNWF